MATSNISNYTTQDAYYKVSFITTHSNSIPKLLKQTGSLIVMNNVDDGDRKSLWFRGSLIASGYGFLNIEEAQTSSFFINNIDNIFGSSYGVYSFLPTYIIGKDDDGEPIYGESVYDRFSYVTETILNTYKDTHERISYVHSYTDALGNQLDNTYSYLVSEIDRTKTETYTYIENKHNEVFSYVKSAYAYLVDSYNDLRTYTLDAYSYTLNYIESSYNTGYATDQTVFSYCTAYTGDLIYTLHKYVDKAFEKIVGGAPDTMDSLGEIAYWLRAAKQLGLDTVERINLIQNTYMAHDPAIVNPGGTSYVYLSNQSQKLIERTGYATSYVESGNLSYENLQDYVYIGNDWYAYTYSYTYYDFEPSAYYAIYDRQVTVENFDNLQLSEVILKTLPPYPYKKPEVVPDAKSLYNISKLRYEIGDTVPINLRIKYNNYDADSIKIVEGMNPPKIDNVTEFAQTGMEQEHSEYTYCLYKKDQYLDYTFNLTLTDTPFTIPDLHITYGPSHPRVYPSTRSLRNQIIDDKNVIPGGELDIDRFIYRIPTYYRMYWNPLENKKDKVSSCLITNNIVWSDPIDAKDSQELYIYIPRKCVDDLRSIKIFNHDTDISHELIGFDSQDAYQLEISNQADYTVYHYIGTRFYIENIIRLRIEFKDNPTWLP